MTKRTKKALLESIEHWHENLDMLILNYLSGERLTKDIRIDSGACPLCQLFFKKYPCKRCPVNEHSNFGNCYATPHRAVMDWMISGDPHLYTWGYQVISDELEFLYSLLE